MTALTSQLVAERLEVLGARARAQMPPGEPVLATVSWLTCDRCGAAIDVSGLPDGSTTAGDFEGGWVDLCRGCSA